MAELEALLSGLRASQYRCAVDSQHSGSRAETLEDRNLQLQVQVRNNSTMDGNCVLICILER